MMNILIFLRERKSSFFGDAGLTNLQRSLTELFGAGSETSATTLLFAFLYMIKHPEVQVSNNLISIYIIIALPQDTFWWYCICFVVCSNNVLVCSHSSPNFATFNGWKIL